MQSAEKDITKRKGVIMIVALVIVVIGAIAFAYRRLRHYRGELSDVQSELDYEKYLRERSDAEAERLYAKVYELESMVAGLEYVRDKYYKDLSARRRTISDN
jgi:uncharacterized protein YxeA